MLTRTLRVWVTTRFSGTPKNTPTGTLNVKFVPRGGLKPFVGELGLVRARMDAVMPAVPRTLSPALVILPPEMSRAKLAVGLVMVRPIFAAIDRPFLS